MHFGQSGCAVQVGLVRSEFARPFLALITLHTGSLSLPLRVSEICRPVVHDAILTGMDDGVAVLFLLNVAKCISYAPLDHTPLIYRLFRDGSLYFMMSVTLSPTHSSVAVPCLTILVAPLVSSPPTFRFSPALTSSASLHDRLHSSSVLGLCSGNSISFVGACVADGLCYVCS